MRRIVLAALLILAVPRAAHAWGDEGHRVVALIARGLMTPAAREAADALLDATGPQAAATFAAAANWADYWRTFHRETAEWHFVDIEIDAPGSPADKLTKACHDFPQSAVPASKGPAQDCVVGRIRAFAAEMADPELPHDERVTALKYLLHFVGDLHQPLHAADHEDRGGNCARIAFGGPRTANLHAWWDTGVVEELGRDPVVLTAELTARITPEQRAAWAEGDAASWALDTFAVAKASAYTLGTPAGCGGDAAPVALPAGYEADARRAASLQLEKAGVRLAAVLDAVLDPGRMPKP